MVKWSNWASGLRTTLRVPCWGRFERETVCRPFCEHMGFLPWHFVGPLSAQFHRSFAQQGKAVAVSGTTAQLPDCPTTARLLSRGPRPTRRRTVQCPAPGARSMPPSAASSAAPRTPPRAGRCSRRPGPKHRQTNSTRQTNRVQLPQRKAHCAISCAMFERPSEMPRS